MIRTALIGTLVVSLVMLTGCATIRKHPAATAIVVGVAVGATIAIIERKGHCPGPYKSGDPPCYPDPDGDRPRTH